MPNVDSPTGFRPVRRVSGLPLGGFFKAYVPSTDGTAIFVGDVVKFNGESGAAGTVVQGEDMEGVPQVIRAAVGDWDILGTDNQAAICGVVVGVKPNPDSLMTKQRLASTNQILYICPIEFDVVFEIQEDGDTTPIVAASVGLNAQVLQTQAGNAVTGMSGMELDSSTVNTTNTFPVRIIGLSKRVGNGFNTAGSNVDQAKFEVIFNFQGGLRPAAVAVGGTAI
jgi:hypothetical protein